MLEQGDEPPENQSGWLAFEFYPKVELKVGVGAIANCVKEGSAVEASRIGGAREAESTVIASLLNRHKATQR